MGFQGDVHSIWGFVNKRPSRMNGNLFVYFLNGRGGQQLLIEILFTYFYNFLRGLLDRISQP